MLQMHQHFQSTPMDTFIRFYEQIPGFPTQEYFPGMMKNCTQQGMLIATHSRLPAGSFIVVQLPIQSDTLPLTIVEIRGIVRRREEQQVANLWGLWVEFCQLRDNEEQYVDELMTHILS